MAAPPSIHRTLGAIFVGFAIGCVMYGALMTQIFHYFRRYPSDRMLYKITVVALGLLETADQAFIGHVIYYYAISNYAQPTVLAEAKMTWSLIMQLTAGAIVGTVVKVFFGLRVWRFSGRNFYITGLILFLTLAQLGLAIAYSIRAFQLPSVFAVHQLQVLGSIALGTGVLTDIVTAGSLCFFLNRLRTGYQSSDSLVNMLCGYAINTGVLTSAASTLTLVLYNATQNNNLYFTATYFILSKLYAISYMATLNTRRQVRGRGTDQQGGAVTNNTNLFPLGTRMPSMVPNEFDQWDKGAPEHSSGMSVLIDTPQHTPNNEFPFNSFYPGTGSRKMQPGQAL